MVVEFHFNNFSASKKIVFPFWDEFDPISETAVHFCSFIDCDWPSHHLVSVESQKNFSKLIKWSALCNSHTHVLENLCASILLKDGWCIMFTSSLCWPKLVGGQLDIDKVLLLQVHQFFLSISFFLKSRRVSHVQSLTNTPKVIEFNRWQKSSTKWCSIRHETHHWKYLVEAKP